MSTPTSKLGLPKPAGNELNNRAGYNAVLDQIDAAAMKDIFYCKTAVYNSGTSKIDVTIGPGVISFLQIVVNKTVDTVYSISSPAINTSYYVYLSSAGAFSSNTTGAEVDGAVMLWKVSTGAALTAISTLDLRGIVNGSAQMVKDLLDSYQSTNDSAVALKAPLASPVLTGTPSAPTAAVNTNTTQLATTAFVEAARVILAAADAAKAPLASPALTGTPTAPTASLGTNTTQLATSAFVQAAIANLISSAPGALDTLNELAAALGNDPNFATTITNALALKAPLASPSLSGIPTAPTAAALTNTTQLATTAFVEAVRVVLAAATALKADTASPALTGNPTAPTQTAGDNSTKIATTAFVEAARVILANADALKAPLASPALTGNPTAPTPAYGDNDTSIATTAFGRANFPLMSNADTTYYVLKTGSDTTTGLTNTAGGAFLTIAKAISMIPQVVNHIYTINVGGGTYNEVLNIIGFSGSGSITVTGNTITPSSVTAQKVNVDSNSVSVFVKGFTSATIADNAFSVTACQYVDLSNNNCSAAASAFHGIYVSRSTAFLINNTISNRNAAISADYGAIVSNYGNSGTGNVTGLLAANSGFIGVNTVSVPIGTTMQSVVSGGVITSGVINPWGDNNSAISKAAIGYQKLPSGLIIQWGIQVLPALNVPITIAYPVAFPTSVAQVTLTIDSSTASPCAVANLLASSFQALQSDPGNKSGRWIAIGY